MKKIYYLLAFIAVIFASCDPLSQTYKNIDANPTVKTLTTAIATTYASTPAANIGIAALLNTKYADYPEGSSAFVTFPYTATVLVPLVPDTLLTRVAYTLVATDYTSGSNYSAAQVLTYLTNKYPTPVANQLAVLTYNYFESGVNAGTTPITDSFIYLAGSWTKVYTVSAAQYAAAGRGANNYFVATDIANLAAYFNSFLQNDPTIIAPKAGDIKYISFKYLATTQRVMALMFDGTNWVSKATLNFLKFQGKWVPDPTIFVTFPDSPNSWTLVTAATSTIGTAAGRTNLLFGDFDIRPTAASFWADADIVKAILVELPVFVPKPVVGVPYKVTYYVYTGSTTTNSKIFVYNGTAFALQQ